MKRAALTNFALDPDPAAHQLDELRRDCQTQPRAAVLARRRAVRLRECLEDHTLLFGRNADAGVTHGEMQHTGVSASEDWNPDCALLDSGLWTLDSDDLDDHLSLAR